MIKLFGEHVTIVRPVCHHYAHSINYAVCFHPNFFVSRAIKSGKGVNSKVDPPIHRVADVSGDITKAKQFFPFLQRAGR